VPQTYADVAFKIVYAVYPVDLPLGMRSELGVVVTTRSQTKNEPATRIQLSSSAAVKVP